MPNKTMIGCAGAMLLGVVGLGVLAVGGGTVLLGVGAIAVNEMNNEAAAHELALLEAAAAEENLVAAAPSDTGDNVEDAAPEHDGQGEAPATEGSTASAAVSGGDSASSSASSGSSDDRSSPGGSSPRPSTSRSASSSSSQSGIDALEAGEDIDGGSSSSSSGGATGSVTLSGDGSVALVGSAGRFQLPSDDVPAGDYDIEVRFSGQDPLEVGSLTVSDGGSHSVKCSSRMGICRAN